MFNISPWKAAGIILVCLFGILFSLPNIADPKTVATWPEWLRGKVSLGLELQGGSHLQFEADLKTVEKERLQATLHELRSQMRKKNIGYVNLKVEDNGDNPSIRFNLRNPSADMENVKNLIKKIDRDIEVTVEGADALVITTTVQTKEMRAKQILEQSIEVIRRRIDESGTKEPTILRQGYDRIVVQLPGVEDPAEVKRLIGKTAKLSFRIIDGEPVYGNAERPALAPGSEWLESTDNRRGDAKEYYPVKKQNLVTGEHLSDAQVTQDQNGGAAVSLTFDPVGARQFGDMSKDHLGKQTAIVLDGKIISAPKLQVVVYDGRVQITGHFTIQVANELATLLRAGALPAPLKVVEERTVGPSLGSDSVSMGKSATVYAFILVAVFMVLGYSLFGMFANIALVFNLVLLFAGLSLLGATLTLPGIAGIAMTIGMAVDANVLIYERIKEEMRRGLKPMAAIEAGYQRAMATIIDSNLTTLIGAAVLYEFSSGPIRGFGVTLALGIVISMFTALSVTKLITAWWFRNRQIVNLPI